MAEKIKVVVFGGGCFWCTEAIFKTLKGVISVTPGYAGGSMENPTHETVGAGKTGHAEVTRIKYDPEKITFGDLLTVFFATHDPTTPDRQDGDVGPQYHSIILYTDVAQKEEAERFIKKLNDSHPGRAQVVTEVKALNKFYEAEERHRDYCAKNPGQAYCRLIISPKLKKVQKEFAELLKTNEK